MTLVLRRNWDPFNSLVRQVDRDFDTLIRRSFGRGGIPGFVPAANVLRDGSDVVIQLDLPGVDVSDVEVEVTDGRLVISGRRSEDRSNEDTSGVLVREIRTGAFRREFGLPEGVSSDQIEAEYDRGILKVRVQNVVSGEVEPKKIEVKTAE